MLKTCLYFTPFGFSQLRHARIILSCLPVNYANAARRWGPQTAKQLLLLLWENGGPSTPGIYIPLRLYSLSLASHAKNALASKGEEHPCCLTLWSFGRLKSLWVVSQLTLAEAKNQKGQQGAHLPLMRGTPLPFTAGAPLPRKAKNAPARRRMPQLAKRALARNTLAFNG